MILIGVLMIGAVRQIDWSELRSAIPAFLTLIMIPFSVSITDGLAWGMISYSLISLVCRRTAPVLVHLLAALFVLRYALL